MQKVYALIAEKIRLSTRHKWVLYSVFLALAVSGLVSQLLTSVMYTVDEFDMVTPHPWAFRVLQIHAAVALV